MFPPALRPLLLSLSGLATCGLAATTGVAAPLPAGDLAAVPLATDALLPFNPSRAAVSAADVLSSGSVETFDPVARARVLARDTPRTWTGTYQSFDTGEVVAVQLHLASLRPMGQMVDFRGEMSFGSVTTPVQGNLNAESDQLDLLLLCDCDGVAGLELGGQFSGLQGLSLAGWLAPRLTSQGGRLELSPAGGAASGASGRGLQ